MIRKRFPMRGDVYRRALTFLYGSRDDINARLRKELGIEGPLLEPSCDGKYVIYQSSGFEADYLCVVDLDDRNREFAVLAHESLHYVAHTLRRAGMPFTDDTEEAYCYYQQHIIEKCMREMKITVRG